MVCAWSPAVGSALPTWTTSYLAGQVVLMHCPTYALCVVSTINRSRRGQAVSVLPRVGSWHVGAMPMARREIRLTRGTRLHHKVLMMMMITTMMMMIMCRDRGA